MSFGNLAAVLAQGMRGKRLGEDRQYARDQDILATQRENAGRQEESQWRRAQAERQAMLDERQAAITPLQQELLRVQVEDAKAQAAGTGRHAPKPERDPVSEYRAKLDVDRELGIGNFAPQRPQQSAPVNLERFTGADGTVMTFNPRTGETKQVTAGDGQPVRGPVAAPRPPTEGMRKAAAFYTAGKQGYDTLESVLSGDDPTTPEVEDGGARPVPSWLAQQGAKLGIGAGNVMTSAQMRQMRQAGNLLADAWLRYTSGAAVPETEVERFAESFLPRAGDDEQTLRQKSASRKTILAALRAASGESVPDPTDATAFPENPYR